MTSRNDRRDSWVTAAWAAVACFSQLIYVFLLAPVLPDSYAIRIDARGWRPEIMVDTASMVSFGWVFVLGIAVVAVFSVFATRRGDTVGGFGSAFFLALVAPVAVTAQLSTAVVELRGLDSSVTAFLIPVAIGVGLLSVLAFRGARIKRSPANPDERKSVD